MYEKILAIYNGLEALLLEKSAYRQAEYSVWLDENFEDVDIKYFTKTNLLDCILKMLELIG